MVRWHSCRRANRKKSRREIQKILKNARIFNTWNIIFLFYYPKQNVSTHFKFKQLIHTISICGFPLKLVKFVTFIENVSFTESHDACYKSGVSNLRRNRFLSYFSVVHVFLFLIWIVSCFQNMFGYAVKHHAKRASVEVQNNATLTPLTLSSKLGRNEIFKEIIELQSIVSKHFENGDYT